MRDGLDTSDHHYDGGFGLAEEPEYEFPCMTDDCAVLVLFWCGGGETDRWSEGSGGSACRRFRVVARGGGSLRGRRDQSRR